MSLVKWMSINNGHACSCRDDPSKENQSRAVVRVELLLRRLFRTWQSGHRRPTFLRAENRKLLGLGDWRFFVLVFQFWNYLLRNKLFLECGEAVITDTQLFQRTWEAFHTALHSRHFRGLWGLNYFHINTKVFLWPFSLCWDLHWW